MKFSVLSQPSCKVILRLVAGLLLLTGLIGFALYTGSGKAVRPQNDVKVFIPGGFAWQHNFKAAILGDTELFPLLKVAVPPKARMAGLLSPYGDGFDRDLLERFAHDYGFSLQFTEVVSFDRACALLSQGKVDLAAGFTAPADYADEAQVNNLSLGPAYQKVSPVLLSVGKTRSNESELMVIDPELTEVVQNSTAALKKKPLSDDVSDLVTYLEQGQTGYALIDNAYLSMLRPLFNDVKTSVRSLSGSISHHWIWRNDNTLPALSLAAFWKDKTTDRYLEDLHEKYRAFLPSRPSKSRTMALIKGLELELEQYHNAINDAAREFNIDPLLLTAVMYQESEFKHTTGQTGQGLMQLTESTAVSLGVDAYEPSSNIRGGAKYLRSIFDSLPKELAYWDKWFLTLAGYNQGPGTLNSAMRIAERNNEELSWRAVKEAYLYMENHPGEANRSRVRGKQVVNYVQNIRYYYYVLNGLVILDRPEAQHLTPLLAGVGAMQPLGM